MKKSKCHICGTVRVSVRGVYACVRCDLVDKWPVVVSEVKK